MTNVVSFLSERKEAGFWVYGAAGEAGRLVPRRSTSPAAWSLVFGAEGRGLRPLVARTCDELAAIPMRTRPWRAST